MATTYDPNVEGSGSVSSTAGPSLHPEMDRFQRPASPVRPPSSRKSGPRPIPNFVFPALPPPSSESYLASSESPRSASPSREEAQFPLKDASNRPAALPSFSFNPGASLPPDPHSPMLLSPPTSPHSPKPSPNRPVRHGHRRGGSEFVGGSIRDGNSIAVMSTSPTKEGGFMPQSLQPPPRRGHRRGVSGAISTNDLPILPPPVVDWTPKGGSAPNSPTNFDQGVNATIPLPDDPPSLTSLPGPVHRDAGQPDTADISPVSDSSADTVKDSKPAKAPSRARVGFSDTLEFIPRPLSLVSSDTSSTVTARPPHSVSGSISSLVSPTSPGEREHSPAPPPVTSSRELEESRPSTAGAILEQVTAPASGTRQHHTSPRRRNSIPTLLNIAESSAVSPPTPSPTKSKRWSFFGLEPFSSSGQAPRSRPMSSSASEFLSRPCTGSSSEHGSESDVTEHQQKKSRRSKKKTVKGWAGSILPLKTKGDKKSSKPAQIRPPTPPASITPLDGDDEEDEAADDALNVFRPTEMPTPPQPAAPPKRSEDSKHPMIDLDAALGPFNTPLPHNPEWEAAQKAAGNVNKRRLHSAQGMKGFAGPGMHYHRRAESAPDLPPFDPGRAGIHRFGSNSTMADVFEEDEEEETDDTAATTQPASESGSKNDMKTEAGNTSDTASETTSTSGKKVRRTSSGLSDKDQISARSVRAECSKTSLHESVIVEEPSQSSAPVRSPVLMTHGSRDSMDSGAPSPKRIMPMAHDLPADAVPVMVSQGAAMPLSPYSMSNASSYPSPRSPMSMDAQRISTAPSSVADDNCFQSLLMGEPGPEVRISVDYDIPSLTSSTSTMTRESAFTPTARPYPPNIREQRPSSVSSAAFGRRRSSLISLSRLISSSHGERSKLSTELTPDGDAHARLAKKSKTKKLGRMMQFWKPTKEESSTGVNTSR